MVQPCLADNDGGQIRGAVVHPRSSNPGPQHQRPSTHAEDHPLLLNHEGGTQPHRRRYGPLIPSAPHALPPFTLPVWEDACSVFIRTVSCQQRAERKDYIEGMWRYKSAMKPELYVGDSLENIEKDDTLRELRGQQGKGEGTIWIWVKCRGNSRWPVKDDSTGCSGLGLGGKGHVCPRCPLLYHPASEKNDSTIQ